MLDTRGLMPDTRETSEFSGHSERTTVLLILCTLGRKITE